jgi:hypothetical protein
MSIYAISLCINSLYHLYLRFIYFLMLAVQLPGEDYFYSFFSVLHPVSPIL